MNEERLYQVILGPVISEKATQVAEGNGKRNQIVLRVLPDATKKEVAAAAEKLFEVKVSKVQILNVRGKVKRTGRIQGKQKNWKKAYVCLQEGMDFDFLGLTGS